MNKPTKAQVKTERSPAKRTKVLEKMGYPKGKLPAGKEAHHKKPIGEGGKTTPANLKVVTKKEHKKIHKNNRAKGKI